MWQQILPFVTTGWLVVMVANTGSLGAQGTSSDSRKTASASNVVLARVDGESIAAEEVEEALAGQIAKLEEQIYRLKRQRIDVLVDQRLLAREATRRGISKEALVAAEITAKAGSVSENEIDAYHEENSARLPSPSQRVRDQIRTVLQQRKWEARGQQFLAELRAAAHIEVLLAEPRALRAEVSAEGEYVRGPVAAPVTIVEFTDFHCPFCQRVQPTLAMVLAKYAGQVRLVHRDFPIDALHANARQAHEAARCAGEQGAFWKYREELFSQSPKSGTERLTASAREIGLDVTTFQQCLADRKFKDLVDRDVKEGTRAGITGTPTVFINGRRLEGARSLETFVQIIDEELVRAAAKNVQANAAR
jgi:protein-disulfide isomerase